jgi:hypothetical protein
MFDFQFHFPIQFPATTAESEEARWKETQISIFHSFFYFLFIHSYFLFKFESTRGSVGGCWGDKKGKIFSSVFWSVASEREEVRNSVCVCV